jgi:predicted nucleic acid-binding protein
VKILLDTNAYSAIGRGHPAAVEIMRRAKTIAVSTVMLGEVLAGFRQGSRWDENLASLRRFLAQPRVNLVPVSWTTADRYSRIRTALRRKGKPIPTNDVWIAAHALETGADLISFDPHFENVEGLAWVSPDG